MTPLGQSSISSYSLIHGRSHRTNATIAAITAPAMIIAATALEELKGEVAAADRTPRILEAMVMERDGTLPRLPGGPPLKH